MRVLVLGSLEIYHHPRLVKAADCFLEQEWSVTVYSPYFGTRPRAEYEDFVQRRRWTVRTFDLSRQSLVSWLRWFFVSVIHRICGWLWARGIRIGFPYALNKSTLGIRLDPRQYDVLLLNLVDNLPVAVRLKRRNPALRIIYDSQEYFQGQYSMEDDWKRRWVRHAETEGIGSVDYLLATTNVMKERLQQELAFPPERCFRVRNVPLKGAVVREPDEGANRECRPLRLVWHGMTIYYGNRRGLHIIVEALAAARCNAELFIQGIPVGAQVAELTRAARKLGILDRIHILDPADPDRIVESLVSYDVGVAGEIPQEENQRLTSSNKLFEWIAAGLATLAPDVPGLRETVEEFETGLLFEPGNTELLALAIEQLDSNRILLQRYKRNSIRAATGELSWKKDFNPVLCALQK